MTQAPTPASPTPAAPALDKDLIVSQTITWLERAVIGLNLCPFAKAEHVHGRIHYEVSAAQSAEALMEDLGKALEHLLDNPPETVETSLLIHPLVFQDFLDYNDFLADVEDLLARLNLEGIVQVASFHPQFQFADTEPDDIENYTNRAPYPTLHLLREESLDRAVEAFPQAEEIFERNIETMKQLRLEGWKKLFRD